MSPRSWQEDSSFFISLLSLKCYHIPNHGLYLYMYLTTESQWLSGRASPRWESRKDEETSFLTMDYG